MRKLLLFFPILLAACQQSTSTPPAVSITSPAVGQPVSGTAQVQVSATSSGGIAKVTLYARSRGSSGPGLAVGSATSEPFVVPWYTPGMPNLAELELYADAEDISGAHSVSDPVWVKTNNVNAPSLSYVAAYTLPPAAVGSSSLSGQAVSGLSLDTQAQRTALFDRLLPDRLLTQLPEGKFAGEKVVQASPSNLTSQATASPQFALEWAWQPVSGASGYRIWQAQTDLVGPYTNVFNQLATVGTQKFSRTLTDAKAGSNYYGLVTAVSSGNEGGDSNADPATFLAAQTLESPAAGAVVADGRPNLNWTATPGAVGYLWFVSGKPQATATPADWLCTNSPGSTDALTSLYPSRCPTLKTGTYYWWVSGVSFNTQGQADAFTLSSDRSLTVP